MHSHRPLVSYETLFGFPKHFDYFTVDEWIFVFATASRTVANAFQNRSKHDKIATNVELRDLFMWLVKAGAR